MNARVKHFDNGSTLVGSPSDELIEQSQIAPSGAVPAYLDADGVWCYVNPANVEHYRKQLGEEVLTVFVEGAGVAGRAGALCRDVAARIGHDGTGDLRVIVEHALRENPDVTVDEVVEIVREQESDAAAERVNE